MSSPPERNAWRYFSLFGQGIARVALINFLFIAIVMSLYAIEAAEPETAAELSSAMALGSVAGYSVSVFDPFAVVLVVWSFVPFCRAAYGPAARLWHRHGPASGDPA